MITLRVERHWKFSYASVGGPGRIANVRREIAARWILFAVTLRIKILKDER